MEPLLDKQSLQHFAPCRGLATEIQRCVEVAIGTDNVGLDAVIVGVAAVLGLDPGVGGAEQRGGGGRCGHTAGKGGDPGIEGALRPSGVSRWLSTEMNSSLKRCASAPSPSSTLDQSNSVVGQTSGQWV